MSVSLAYDTLDVPTLILVRTIYSIVLVVYNIILMGDSGGDETCVFVE